MFIDTHTHLFSDVFDEDRDQVIQRAIQSGVELCLLPNIDVDTIDAMHELELKYPENCHSMMGLHPGSVGEDWKNKLDIIKTNLFSREYIAVGEIGMDLYWDKTYIDAQREVFAQQVRWAKELKIPVVIHARSAFQEIYEVLDVLDDENLSGVFHCFTGTLDDANKIAEYHNFKLGIGGVLTYKNAKLDRVIKQIPLDQLILETDSPYLPPTPHRGKRNESSYLLHVAEKLADVYGLPLQEIEKQTTETAKKLFKL
ncbi:MAG: TatD family hydrolase [Crocinitomicaceae bacterium]|nr:TatD family hydrolase [Crocinitomicaceae bacterium]MDG1776276.1 TatD family hydrolase [Crocinitomicaceae bacterium]